MAVGWEEDDMEYFRRIGIAVQDESPDTRAIAEAAIEEIVGTATVPVQSTEYDARRFVLVFLLWMTVGGSVLYGLLLLGAWVLRALGVNITGI